MPFPGCVSATCSTLTQAVARLRERQMPWSINAYAALAGKLFSRTGRISRPPGSGGGRGALLPSTAPDSRADRVARAANYLFLRCDRPDFDLQYALLRSIC
jgi:threonine-phosphate decarboxylase